MRVSLVNSLYAAAAAHPDRNALSWHQARWNYAGLAEAVDAVACELDALGVEPGDRVGLLIRNSPEYVAGYYGVLAAGGVAVPLNAHERAVVLARQVDHADARVVLMDPNHPESAALREVVRDRSTAVVDVPVRDGTSGLADFLVTFSRRGTRQPKQRPIRELAVIIYTSGTTGSPKGVMLSHDNLAANAAAIRAYLELTADDRGLCVLPFHFSYGNSVLQSHLLAGAQLVIEDNLAFPHQTLRRMQDEAITGFAGVPSTFGLLLGRCRFEDYDLSMLRYVTQAGGAMPRSHIERLRAVLPHARVFIMYGQTEATARLTYLPPELLDSKLGSVGRPLQDVELQIRSPDGDVLPFGEVGEIHARGPNVMMGYWRNPEMSQQVLRNGWLATGDLGRLDADGCLFIEGRVTEMIKVGAFRVSPQEVEEVLSTYPGVEEVAVAAVPDEALGQAVKAVMVLKAGTEADPRHIKAFCRQRLASYKIPKSIEFAAALPRTSSGKVQRFRLA